MQVYFIHQWLPHPSHCLSWCKIPLKGWRSLILKYWNLGPLAWVFGIFPSEGYSTAQTKLASSFPGWVGFAMKDQSGGVAWMPRKASSLKKWNGVCPEEPRRFQSEKTTLWSSWPFWSLVTSERVVKVLCDFCLFIPQRGIEELTVFLFSIWLQYSFWIDLLRTSAFRAVKPQRQQAAPASLTWHQDCCQRGHANTGASA